MNHSDATPDSPRWLHAVALVTLMSTLPLLFLGAGVTSHGVGMVDPQGFRPPWEIINGLLENNGLGWRLEYGHRTFGFFVGMCGIVLAIGCWFFDRRPWMGWVGFLALAMICAQGLLGIYRVNLNSHYPRALAMIHGIFAQLVFATLITTALFTSRRWTTPRDRTVSSSVRRWSLACVVVVFAQLVLGGLVRHQETLLGPRGHLLGAFVTVAAVVWLLIAIKQDGSSNFQLERIALMALMTLQLLLGVESWLARFYVPGANLPQLAPAPTHAEWLRTVHYLVGTLIFAATVSTAWLARRDAFAASPINVTAVSTADRSPALEGAL